MGTPNETQLPSVIQATRFTRSTRKAAPAVTSTTWSFTKSTQPANRPKSDSMGES